MKNKKNESEISQQKTPITQNFFLFNRLTNVSTKFSYETAERGEKFTENIKRLRLISRETFNLWLQHQALRTNRFQISELRVLLKIDKPALAIYFHKQTPPYICLKTEY